MKLIISILKNPFSLWLYWLVQKTYLELKYWKKKVVLGYLTNVHKSTFGGYNQLYDNVRLWHSSIGEYSYIAKNSQITRTHIGKFCAIGPNVQMGLGTHPTKEFVSIHPAFYSTFKQVPISFSEKDLFVEHRLIIVGNDVWIGANAIIADGITIGDGAIIAAGAVVAKNVAPYEVVGGVPAKFIKKRFTDDQIKFLLEFKWWDKNKDWHSQNASLMSDIEKLRSKYAQ
jgi:acetyltransferase-like isoleucine patch superfamily enzyme